MARLPVDRDRPDDARLSHHTDRVRRRAALALRALVLFGFAVFFAVPLVWLVLAADEDGLRARHPQPVRLRQLP